MTSTIEVPISLIKAGDMDAIRELLPKPSLFGRWATHPRLGRGLIISGYLDLTGRILFASAKENGSDDARSDWVPLDSLTLDPVELVTEQDFENAPRGTVVANPTGNAYQKVYADCWESVDDELSNERMAAKGPWKILRWGWGEQQ
ncbi:hypothetical protein ACEE90_03530 [Corynebacterium phoceense]